MPRHDTAAKALALSACLLLAGCATTQRAPSPQDPWEGMNRATFRFNDALDRAVLKPVAKGYREYVPRFAQTGINNFLTNLAYPTTIVNNVLQLKLLDAAGDTARFVINSTLGLAGLFDPATDAGLPRNDEDFGQTLGWWGVKPGPYLVLPLLGPSTLRDTPARAADYYTDLSNHVDDDEAEIGLNVLSVIDTRARLLPAERALEGAFDRYALVRNAFLERREFQVRDGDVATEPADAGFSDDELDQLEQDMAEEDAAAAAPAADPEAAAAPSGDGEEVVDAA